jgi:hypothetical protein
LRVRARHALASHAALQAGRPRPSVQPDRCLQPGFGTLRGSRSQAHAPSSIGLPMQQRVPASNRAVVIHETAILC